MAVHNSRLRLGLLRLAAAVPAAVFVNDTFVGLVEVHTGTAHHSLRATSNWMLTNRVSPKVRNGELQRNDIVVVRDPYNPNRNFVRRVGAVGKEWVRVQDNGNNAYHVYIQEGYCWLEDVDSSVEETKHAYDSRKFGPVSLGLIVGFPFFDPLGGGNLGKISKNDEKDEED